MAVGARRWLPFGPAAPLDLGAFAFVAALSLSTGLAFSLVPALRATGVDTASALRESGRSVARSRSLLASALLVVQVAVSVVLLVGAGLFLQTLANLRAVDVGFDADDILLFRVDPRFSGYDGERAAAVYDRLAESLRSVPGVRSVSLSTVAFLTRSVWMSSLYVEGGEAAEKPHQPHMNVVSRMALGAQGSDVTRMVLRESLVLAGVGVGLGIAAALASGRLIERLLFELAPTDGSTFAQAIAVMGAVAAFAAYLPARRAARVDPMVALRCE